MASALVISLIVMSLRLVGATQGALPPAPIVKTVDLIIMLPYFAEHVLGGRERVGKALERDGSRSSNQFENRHGDVVYRELRQPAMAIAPSSVTPSSCDSSANTPPTSC